MSELSTQEAPRSLELELISGKQLAEAAGVSPSTVTQWRKAGLPAHGKRYNLHEANQWLIMQGKIEPSTINIGQQVFRTIEDLRAELGYTDWSVRKFFRERGFPGTPRSHVKGAKYGYYPLADILNWLKMAHPRNKINGLLSPAGAKDAAAKRQDSPASSRARLDRIKADHAELKLMALRGELIEVSVVSNFFARFNSYCVTLLETLPTQIDQVLPESTDDATRLEVNRHTKACVRRIRETVERMLREADFDEDEGD